MSGPTQKNNPGSWHWQASSLKPWKLETRTGTAGKDGGPIQFSAHCPSHSHPSLPRPHPSCCVRPVSFLPSSFLQHHTPLLSNSLRKSSVSGWSWRDEEEVDVGKDQGLNPMQRLYRSLVLSPTRRIFHFQESKLVSNITKQSPPSPFPSPSSTLRPISLFSSACASSSLVIMSITRGPFLATGDEKTSLHHSAEGT